MVTNLDLLSNVLLHCNQCTHQSYDCSPTRRLLAGSYPHKCLACQSYSHVILAIQPPAVLGVTSHTAITYQGQPSLVCPAAFQPGGACMPAPYSSLVICRAPCTQCMHALSLHCNRALRSHLFCTIASCLACLQCHLVCLNSWLCTCKALGTCLQICLRYNYQLRVLMCITSSSTLMKSQTPI